MTRLQFDPEGLGHVLLVDDDTGLRESIASVLRFAGYKVQAWDSAAAFLQEVPAVAPAVLVADMRMPGMTGVEMHAILRQRGFAFPVVYISGESTVAQSVRAMKQGAFDFLVKPFGRDELLVVVAAALERDRQQMQHKIRIARADAARASLSPRQRQVHDLLIKGFGNREIMDALSISLPTAKQYKSEVLQKLGVRSLSELIAFSRVVDLAPTMPVNAPNWSDSRTS